MVVKVKFKKLSSRQKADYTFKGCDVCCLVGKKECKTADCGGGYMVEIKRPSKHERLLKALLKSAKTGENCGGKFIYFVEYPFITKEERKQLIAFKERMEKKGAKV